MRAPRLLALLLAAALALPAMGQGKACSKADEANATKAIDRIVSWSTLHAAYKAYRHCDGGEISGQFTEAILRQVIDWKSVDQFANAMKDAEYRSFIISHLQSPAAKEDASDVYSRAKANCPKGLEAFCKDLADAMRPPAPPAPEPPAPVAAPAPAAAPAPPASPKN